MINFKSIPFVRILFPFVLGIITSVHTGVFYRLHLLTLFAFCAVTITFMFQRFYKKQISLKKPLYIISVNVFLFLLANEVVFQYQDINKPTHYSKSLDHNTQACFVSLNDIPVKTENYTKLSVEVNLLETNAGWKTVTGKTVIYISDTLSQTFGIGDQIWVNTKFATIAPPQNPYEFNYKHYLQNRNIYHVVYANSKSLARAPDFTTQVSLASYGIRIKQWVVQTLRHSGLSHEAFSVCAALLVGYDDEINNAVMQSFSHSGTLHVLSVSGMHTGVLFAVLLFLFDLLDKDRRYKKLRCVTVVLALFFFVLITGFTPAVLRAALMLSLVVIGQSFYQQSNSFNTLFLSAFILLLFNPFLIYDVGFLLSYSAVFGIMYLYPILSQVFYIENWLLKKLLSLTLMSLSATLFTLPISLFYFHQFPTWFVFSNLVIIPLSTLLLVLTVLLLAVSSVTWASGILVYAMNGLNNLMLWFAQLTDEPGSGYIDNVHFSCTDFWFLSALIIVGLVLAQNKQYKTALLGLTLVFIWQIISMMQVYEQSRERELLVFYVKKKPLFIVRQGNKVYMNQNDLSPKEMDRLVKPYLLSLHHYQLHTTSANCWKTQTQHILHCDGKTLVDRPTATSDYIIVSDDTDISRQLSSKNTALVIADCSNSSNFVKKLKQQCALADVPFYSIKQQGALRVKL